jgi:hypothetical protein
MEQRNGGSGFWVCHAASEEFPDVVGVETSGANTNFWVEFLDNVFEVGEIDGVFPVFARGDDFPSGDGLGVLG